MSIERKFDISFISSLALREKQIQQNYRPVIAVHKWFARRPGTLFRGLLLSEFGEGDLRDAFYQANKFPGRKIADPFMGGGTPLLEANRVGCDVVGLDINPMSAWIVREEIEQLDLPTYEAEARSLMQHLETEAGAYYRTHCLKCGDEAPVKYFIWVKVQDCLACKREFDLFPGYLLAKDRRHPKNVLVCSACDELNEVGNLNSPGACRECDTGLQVQGPAKRNKCQCPHCGHLNKYPNPNAGVPKHRMFAIEYYCPTCKPQHKGRFFKKPGKDDLERCSKAAERWEQTRSTFVPTEEILSGDETDRLHRWGYQYYRDLFNPRQLFGLELSSLAISKVKDRRVLKALATNLSDLLRYQNMLCRYDTMALKSLDIFSIHGFPVGLVQCESNLLGIANDRGINVGSGGWLNIIGKYRRAKKYCDEPFEIIWEGSRKIQVPITGEWIGECRKGEKDYDRRKVSLHCQSATEVELAPQSLDAVLTDPPYFGNVQYGELMDFLYVWLRRLVGNKEEGFDRHSTRDPNELTGNVTMNRGLEHFTEGLATIFRKIAQALKPGAPLAFTYHHNKIEAYHPVGVAMLDAELVCSASMPCAAEMSGSIHIRGTGSSIVDTVFICRSTGTTFRRWLFQSLDELTEIVNDDVAQLQAGKLKASLGDVRCIIYGHLTRMAVWHLRESWNLTQSVDTKLRIFHEAMTQLGDPNQVIQGVEQVAKEHRGYGDLFDKSRVSSGEFEYAVSF